MSENNTRFFVLIIGDWLPLPQQFHGIEFHQTYPYLPADWLRQQRRAAEVWEGAMADTPIRQIFAEYDEYQTYVGQQDHKIGIARLGVVDCSPRLAPFWVRNAIGWLPGLLHTLASKSLHTYHVSLLRYGPGFLFTKSNVFRRACRQLLKHMSDNFSSLYAVDQATSHHFVGA